MSLFRFKFTTFLKLRGYQIKYSNFSMIKISEITAEQTYPIRQTVLRQNEPLEKCIYPFDTDDSTLHFGLFESDLLVGIISIFETKKELFVDDKQYQIRGMAVLENHQKKGYGGALVRHAVSQLQKEKNFLVWFNARIIAVGFYEKLNFEKIGDLFEIVPIGDHYVMFKRYRERH